jgi:hypothetical protein
MNICYWWGRQYGKEHKMNKIKMDIGEKGLCGMG